MTKLIVFGIGKIADVFYDCVRDSRNLSIAGFTCDREFMHEQQRHGLPVVPFEDLETFFPPSDFAMFIAIGYQSLNEVRAERCRQAQTKGYRLVSWVSPAAHMPEEYVIGANCFVTAGAALQPYAHLGDNVFVWSGAVVGHHATIGDHCWLASNCTVSSTANVDPRCFIGVNAAIGHGVTVGARSIIGAAAVITHDTAAGGVYVVRDTERFRLDSQSFVKIARLT